MTLILETPRTDIHRCPECGAQCAVEKSALSAAANAGQSVQIACHKCDEVFRPGKDTKPQNDTGRVEKDTGSNFADSPAKADQNSKRAANASIDNEFRGRVGPLIGSCPKCRNHFSVPPMPAQDIMIECPHCKSVMTPDSVGRLNARSEILASRLTTTPPPKKRMSLFFKLIIGMFLAGSLMAGVLAGALFEITPKASNFAGLGNLVAGDTPRVVVSETMFHQITDDGAPIIMVSVTLSNLGTGDGAPDKISVALFDIDGKLIVNRVIASRPLPMIPGETRAFVARFAAPDRPVYNVEANLTLR
ncbi:hypothetical protein N9E91_03725 [Alphaproteobacteria bacterium]|nr:hypothetical protein [Alphaproteobacteria bacterium]